MKIYIVRGETTSGESIKFKFSCKTDMFKTSLDAKCLVDLTVGPIFILKVNRVAYTRVKSSPFVEIHDHEIGHEITSPFRLFKKGSWQLLAKVC